MIDVATETTPSPAPSVTETQLPSTAPTGEPNASTTGDASYSSLSEEYRSNDKIKSFKSQDDLAKSWMEAQSLIGKKGVLKPEEGAGQDAWNEYYNSLGRPESTEGYKFEVPEGAQFDADIQAKLNTELHGMGITADQYEKLMPIYMNEMSRLQEAQQASLNAHKTERSAEWGNALKESWGEQFETNAKVVNEFVSKPQNEKLMTALMESGLNNNPDIANMILNYTRSTSEDTVVGAPQGGGNLTESISKLTEKLGGMAPNDPARQEVLLQRRKLFELKQQ